MRLSPFRSVSLCASAPVLGVYVFAWIEVPCIEAAASKEASRSAKSLHIFCCDAVPAIPQELNANQHQMLNLQYLALAENRHLEIAISQ